MFTSREVSFSIGSRVECWARLGHWPLGLGWPGLYLWLRLWCQALPTDTASDCIDLAWHGLEATSSSLSSVRPDQARFGLEAGDSHRRSRCIRRSLQLYSTHTALGHWNNTGRCGSSPSHLRKIGICLQDETIYLVRLKVRVGMNLWHWYFVENQILLWDVNCQGSSHSYQVWALRANKNIFPN